VDESTGLIDAVVDQFLTGCGRAGGAWDAAQDVCPVPLEEPELGER